MVMMSYPGVLDATKFGSYAGLAKAGRGYVWDEVLTRPRRTETPVSDFLSPNAPANRLDILRGVTS